MKIESYLYRQDAENVVLFVGEIKISFNFLIPLFDPFDFVGRGPCFMSTKTNNSHYRG